MCFIKRRWIQIQVVITVIKKKKEKGQAILYAMYDKKTGIHKELQLVTEWETL